jgi:general secretion pathway protein D
MTKRVIHCVDSLGTRNASTVLRLHEGETQALAGLIKSDSQESGSHVPGLGKLPVLGRLFSNNSDTSTRSEIVLLITPHIARSLAMPNAYAQAFPSGTADHVSTAALRLTPAAQYSDSDNLPPTPTAADKATSTARDAGAQAIASAAATQSSGHAGAVLDRTESVRFELVIPSQANSKSSFPVSLIASGHDFEKAEMDLVLDQPGTHLLKASPRNGVALDANQEGNVVHITIGKANAAGPLVILTLQSDMSTGGILNLSLQNPKVEKDDHTQLNSAVGLPGQINIAP